MFWALAGRARRRRWSAWPSGSSGSPPTPDGLAHLTAWIDEFMALHEAWAAGVRRLPGGPPGARRQGRELGRRQRRHREGAPPGVRRAGRPPATAAVARLLVALLIRCSLLRRARRRRASTAARWSTGLARLFHRTLAGPLIGVNVRPGRPQAPHEDPRAHLPTRPTRVRRSDPGASAPDASSSTQGPRCCPPAATTTPASTTSSRPPGSATAPSTGTSTTRTTSSGCWPRRPPPA